MQGDARLHHADYMGIAEDWLDMSVVRLRQRSDDPAMLLQEYSI